MILVAAAIAKPSLSGERIDWPLHSHWKTNFVGGADSAAA
jgi:hypothetical protein